MPTRPAQSIMLASASHSCCILPQAYTTYKLGGQISELLYSPATYGIDLSAKDMIKPRARWDTRHLLYLSMALWRELHVQ
jgi:hypothetical protein